MKEAKLTNNVNIFTDSLLRATVVVEAGGQWYLVPKSANGWKRRQRLNITAAVRLERLRSARHISPEWLGILAEDEPQDCP